MHVLRDRRRHRQVRTDVRTKSDDVVGRAHELVPLADVEVLDCNRRIQRADGDRGHRQIAEHAHAQCARSSPHAPHADGHDREAEEEQVIAVRHRLEPVRDRRAGECRPRSCIEVAMQPEKRERHPAGHHRLQVTGLRHVVRVEREDRCGDDRRADAPSERAREHEHRCAGKDERREEDRVVAEDRVAGRPLDRRGEHRDAEQMLGERERVVERIEDWHLPEAAKAVAGTLPKR